MTALALDRDWLARLHARANRPPLRERVPLLAGSACIGSVEPDFFERLVLPGGLVLRQGAAWQVQGPLTPALNSIAHAMREQGLAHAWRDEQLPVTDESGAVLGTVERAVVRPLGITTFAVHLAGAAPDGRHWVQRRAFNKPNDPGLWDTLMGGLVPASDTLDQALARETWEEAGLRLEQLSDLRHGGRVSTRVPSRDVPMGYVVEHIDWFTCVVPEGVEPRNQDGEVERFEPMSPADLAAKLHAGEFTLEAALVLAQAAAQAARA